MRTWPALDVGPVDEPDLLQTALHDWNIAAVDETTRPGAWRVFFRTGTDRDVAVRQIGRQFPDARVEPLDVPDEDWAARSQSHVRAIRIGRVVVAPPWDVPPAAAPDDPEVPVVVVIQPSMGFGTGHHATTRLCLAALQRLPLRHRRVLDVGTGSGVLAIAASRLGAPDVAGVDDDPDAIASATENLSLNPAARVSLHRTDVRAPGLAAADVVLANLTGAVLVSAAARLRQLARPGAHLVLSGFTPREESEVRAAYAGLGIAARAEEDEWVCVTLC